ncbi:DNA oxidative demethylase ALKBH2-like isoform X3 [Schistocerca gregaria]|uniref:DNA oxidative demethylase ALKBH2-like isoform X3 n=1 Tax=Schistocerca gregaria TaxID=7010 RepID=UPI00211E24EE|nr:DNA oxidative demethylase ALKBH2-like isoform X3 [Schistocerca gregaria]
MATPAASHPALMQEDGEASKLCRELEQLAGARPSWRKVTAEGLDVDYTRLLTPALADAVLHELEAGLTYFTGDLARVRVFGRWHPIPRQQVAFGDAGLSYKFSGQTLPASPWPPLLLGMRDALSGLTGVRFNFVLVNSETAAGARQPADDESANQPAVVPRAAAAQVLPAAAHKPHLPEDAATTTACTAQEVSSHHSLTGVLLFPVTLLSRNLLTLKRNC